MISVCLDKHEGMTLERFAEQIRWEEANVFRKIADKQKAKNTKIGHRTGKRMRGKGMKKCRI